MYSGNYALPMKDIRGIHDIRQFFFDLSERLTNFSGKVEKHHGTGTRDSPILFTNNL